MPFSDRLRQAWRWLGLEGVVLLAALAVDVLIVFSAAFDYFGPRGRDLLLLPGILAMAGCALWARKHPARALFAGAAVLVASTALIRYTDASAYSTLLTDLSLTETVAGVELVYLSVRRLRPMIAFAGVSTLVIAALIAATNRSHHSLSSTTMSETLVLGLVLLVGAVAAGAWQRRTNKPPRTGPVAELLRAQWPLIGGLCLPLFLELYGALDHGIRAFPLLICSTAAAILAVLSTRIPLLAGSLISVVFLVSGGATLIAPRGYDFSFGTVPLTQIAAGMVVVVFLIRQVQAAQAWLVIGLMSVTVGITTVAAHTRAGAPDLGSLFIGGLLTLGISVAVGLFFRARDSERTQAVESAVNQAQTSERMALARELHDVVAHHVTGIVVQAQAAKMMGEKNPAVALEALGRIEEAGTEALVAMRRLVRSMRSSADNTEHATTDLDADLRQLAGSAVGAPVVLDLSVTPDIPQEVARSALRLVQESLTNVGKHAPAATRIDVLAEVADGELHVRVGNDGHDPAARPAGGSGGYGLVGMRERVELLHGRLFAGPVDDGWLVEAWLPLEESE
ncbi:two-component sensor histidine kinase [Amycolatopsis acidicola]|uniref:histidine kinase n=1 Tax=Amycolatopsis acidicola TaxID=2596893 RepID=A0A5N0UNP0_9PSEU|nr:histidine kinase [Amycolatopsis acidicola]KAA9151907.1 two-component sensor histidine kinase [Amycolatopsis acidicola]